MMMLICPPPIPNKLPYVAKHMKIETQNFFKHSSLLPILCRMDRKSQCKLLKFLGWAGRARLAGETLVDRDVGAAFESNGCIC